MRNNKKHNNDVALKRIMRTGKLRFSHSTLRHLGDNKKKKNKFLIEINERATKGYVRRQLKRATRASSLLIIAFMIQSANLLYKAADVIYASRRVYGTL